MKRIMSVAALSLSFLATTAAIAGEGYVTTDVSLRAGPDASYPDVAMLYAGTTVAIEGCVHGWSWCDVTTGDSRGWLPADYLQQEYQGQRVLVPEYGVRIGIPIVAFVFGAYWDSHYRHRTWYGERERWSHVTPRYQPLVVQGDVYRRSHISQSTSVRSVNESRPSAVVTTHQERHVNTTTAQHSVRTESRANHAIHTRSVEQRSAESRPTAQQHSIAKTRSEEIPANHGRQVEHKIAATRQVPKPMSDHRPAQSKVIAEHRVAEPKAPKKDTSAKSRPEHQGGKDTEQH
jgi:uncharacterized protein YraI